MVQLVSRVWHSRFTPDVGIVPIVFDIIPSSAEIDAVLCALPVEFYGDRRW